MDEQTLRKRRAALRLLVKVLYEKEFQAWTRNSQAEKFRQLDKFYEDNKETLSRLPY